MIVPMSKVYIVTQSHNHARLLDVLAKLGVVHIEPVDPDRAVAEEQILKALTSLDHAIQILQRIQPSDEAPQMEALDAAKETIAIYKAIADEKERLNSLHRSAGQLTLWGNVELKELVHLRSIGLEIKFYTIPKKDFEHLEAECIEVVAEQSSHEVMVAVIDRPGTFEAPEGAKEIPWPSTDLPSVRKEAAHLDTSLKQHNKRLAELANLTGKMQNKRKQYQTKADFHVAQNSGLSSEALFALQGWVPAKKAESLSADMSKDNITAAVQVMQAAEDEQPPTLIEYPKWVKPIKGLFDMLGTLPGYEEFDLSPFFMVALPIFAAMLIGDAGYGLIFAAAGLIFYNQLVKAAGKPSTHLIIIFGLVTFIWGVLTANYFGVTPETLINAGLTNAAGFMRALAPLWRDNPVAARNLIMQVSLIVGCSHLVLAHLYKAIQLFPDVKSYAEMAWSAILIDMLILIWYLMFIGVDQIPGFIGVVLLVSLITISWCTAPMSNPVKRVLIGFASSILPLLGTFSDIMSYIRLFAVGLASYYIAASFNGLGADVASKAIWLWFPGALIIIFGHVLNIGLAAIAIFAHGVRLNMLEFSNNIGVQWAGHAYRPFTKEK